MFGNGTAARCSARPPVTGMPAGRAARCHKTPASAPCAAVLLLVAVSVAALACIALPTAAYSQEVGLATFHESATILADRTGLQNVTASVTLQSTSTLELQVPEHLEQQMRKDGLVTAVILTNHESCVLGVAGGLSCILVNVERDPDASGIVSLQESAQQTADSYIDALNAAFDTDASHHSVFVHSGRDKMSNTATGLPGTAAGRTTVSVVYVMPMEDTGSMYEKISSILLAGAIRDSGGFYDAARHLSMQDGAKMSFSIVPLDSESLLQLKVISPRPVNASQFDVIAPLELMGLDSIKRSEYFASGFYPLNSVIQVAILSHGDDATVSHTASNVIPTRTVDGQNVPVGVSEAGWIFDSPGGKIIQAKYVFGQTVAVSSGDLAIHIADSKTGNTTIKDIDLLGTDTDEQIMVVIAVVAIAAAAALFYMRGYSGRPRGS